MQDWVDELNKFADIYGKGVLKDAGKISIPMLNITAMESCFTVC